MLGVLSLAVAALAGCKLFDALGVTQRPDVIVLSVESLRADDLGAYGNPDKLTSRMDALAASGILFTNANTPATWAMPALASAFTGYYPSHHGARTARLRAGGMIMDRLNQQFVTLAERLENMGYATYGFVTNGRLDSPSGIDQGIGRYICRDRGTGRTVEAGLDEILPLRNADRENGVPTFLWLHWTDPRFPYQPVRPAIDRLDPNWAAHAERLVWQDTVALARKGALQRDKALCDLLVALHRSEVAAVDESLDRILKRLPGWEDAVVVLFATHGAAFGEHASFGHGYDLFASSRRVPLLIRLPGGQRSGTVVDAPVSLTDLTPTILEAVRADEPADLDGISLLPAASGEPIDRPGVFAELRRPRTSWRAVIGPQYTYVQRGNRKDTYLFDRTTDPAEAHNRLSKLPDQARRMARLIAQLESMRPVYPGETRTRDLTFGEGDALRAAGYLH